MMTTSALSESTELFEVGSNKYVSIAQIKGWCPDVETTLWFAKVFKLNYAALSNLLFRLFKTPVMAALMGGSHSTELQSYLVTCVPPTVWENALVNPDQDLDFVDEPAPGEVLPQLWEDAQVEVAKSIQEVADKLDRTLHLLPSKDGHMLFQSMMQMNRMRPTIGVFKAKIQHDLIPDQLVVLDVSGSMTESTILGIIEDVVALSWKANAHLAIVSNNCYHWEPGSFTVADVLAKCEYGGTQYETLTPLMDRDWGTVIGIADYDSGRDARRYIKANAKGKIGTYLDISLVGRTTFLAECLGQLADEVRPLLIGQGLIRNSGWY